LLLVTSGSELRTVAFGPANTAMRGRCRVRDASAMARASVIGGSGPE
jgi:hypothetical protein